MTRPLIGSCALLALGVVLAHCEPGPERLPLGRFVDISGPIETDAPFNIRVGGPTPIPEAITAFFADIDEDGQLDVVVSPGMFAATPGEPPRLPRVYHYDASTQQLVPTSRIMTPSDTEVIAAGIVMDLDMDGHVDVVDDLGRRLWGQGQGMFLASTVDDTTTAISAQAASVDDIDEDGWLDLVVTAAMCCEQCRDVIPMLATGVRTYAPRGDLIPDGPMANAYAVMSTRVGSGQKLLMALGGGCTGDNGAATFYRPAGLDASGYPHFEAVDPTPPDAAWRQGNHDSVSVSSRVPMGAATGDIDGDGLVDLAMMIDSDHALYRARAALPFEDRSGESGIQTQLGDHTRAMLPWGAALLDLDRDGRLDLVAVHGNDVSAWIDPSHHIGPQWADAYRNVGNFRFESVGAALGIDRRGQWMSLAIGDLDGDGDPDLAVGGQGEWPRIYRNEPDPSAHGFALRLRGTTSNAYGIGSQVEVRVSGLPVQYLTVSGSGSPLVVSEPMVFASLGHATQADRVTVHWVSGYVQELGPLAAGHTYTAAEPEWIAVRPASRHVHADGHSTVTIHVDAQAWSLQPSEVVTVDLPYGTGTMGPTMQNGTGWDATLTAPTSPGSGVIQVRMNGTPAGVRPRIFWD